MDQEITWQAVTNKKPVFLQSPSEGRLVSATIPAPDLSPILVLNHAQGQERFFWQSGQNEVSFAGFGKALEIMAWGQGRYREIKNKAANLFNTADLDESQPDVASPRLFGGFSFRNDFAPDNTWAAFHPAHFIIPHYQLSQKGNEIWLTINAMLAHDEDPRAARKQLLEALSARYAALQGIAPNIAPSRDPVEIIDVNYPMSFHTWSEIIAAAQSSMHVSDLEKVVLARVCELRARRKIDVRAALQYLNRTYSECTRFLFEPRPNHSFFGATPELLVRVRGPQLQTMAFAGSIKRGTDTQNDELMTRQLMNSAKDRHEHALVVNSIKRRLRPFAAHVQAGGEPKVYTLSYIHHLLTTIEAELRQSYGILPLVEAMHPTPALGGTPRHDALDFIRRSEPVPRGWFAGPIGWIDKELDGEFSVAIRSGVVQDRRVWLYAGAGIVADSEADKEWDETSLKFHPMFTAFGLVGSTVRGEK